MLKSMQNDQNAELDLELGSALCSKLDSTLCGQHPPYISYFFESCTTILGMTTRLPPPMLKSIHNDQNSKLDLEPNLDLSSELSLALSGQHLPYISYLSKSCTVVVGTSTRLPPPMLKSMQNDQNSELDLEFDLELSSELGSSQIQAWLDT